MNKPGIKTWKLFVLIVLVVGWLAVPFLLYQVIDQAVTIHYMQIGYRDTEEDLHNLAQFTVAQSPKLTRAAVLESLRRTHSPDQIKEEGSVIRAGSLSFEFGSDGTLVSVYGQNKK